MALCPSLVSRQGLFSSLLAELSRDSVPDDVGSVVRVRYARSRPAVHIGPRFHIDRPMAGGSSSGVAFHTQHRDEEIRKQVCESLVIRSGDSPCRPVRDYVVLRRLSHRCCSSWRWGFRLWADGRADEVQRIGARALADAWPMRETA
jgi:hypothetical protein